MKTSHSLDRLVKEHPFLAHLREEFCDFLADNAELRRFASKQHLFEEAGEADHFYIIVSGGVSLETCVLKDGVVRRLQSTRSQLVELHCLVLANSRGELDNECKYQHQPVHG